MNKMFHVNHPAMINKNMFHVKHELIVENFVPRETYGG